MDFPYQRDTSQDFATLAEGLRERILGPTLSEDGHWRLLPFPVALAREQPNPNEIIFRMIHPVLGDVSAVVAHKEGDRRFGIEIRDPVVPPPWDYTGRELASFREAPDTPTRDDLMAVAFDAHERAWDFRHRQILACYEENKRALLRRFGHDDLLRVPALVRASQILPAESKDDAIAEGGGPETATPGAAQYLLEEVNVGEIKRKGQKYGIRGDTYGKINDLCTRRNNAIRRGDKPPVWTGACADAGIDTKTAKKNAPDLHRYWYFRDHPTADVWTEDPKQ